MKLSLIPSPVSYQEEEGSADINLKPQQQICPDMAREAYRLSIDPERILIQGGSAAALSYGAATLKQLLIQCKEALPCLTIEDEPAYAWRGFHIDCARHFMPVEELKKMIRMAAFFKLNRFHWHISDDQGWRIESVTFPELHRIGAYRNGDHFGQFNSDAREGGYYTRQQVKELVSLCADLGIEVVPEVDMPGHVTAILAAYPHLGCTGRQLEVGMKGGIFKDILCAGKDETYDFLEQLLEELLELFPGKYFHIGGDEAPKIRWNECPACRRRMEQEGLSTLKELQGYLQNRMIAFLEAHGRTAVVWNEALGGGNLNPKALVQLWTEDKERQAAAHLEKGGQVILSTMMNCYCDYPYGFISLKSLYELDTRPKELADAIAAAKARGSQPIAGSECLIWTEFIRDGDKLEQLSWPRYTASAEVGWCGEGRPGYDDFAARLKVLYPAFETYGIKATPQPGWIPSEEEKMKQFAEFKLNFRPEDLAEIREAQEQG